VIAVPLGIGAAIFLAELAPPRVSDTLQFFIDLLAAVPSVIYGLLGVFIIVPLMRTVIYPALNKPFGYLPIFKGPSYGVGFMIAGDLAAYAIGLITELEFGGHVSLIVFLTLYFLFFISS